VIDPLFPVLIEMFDVALRSYFMTPDTEHILSKPQEIKELTMDLKFGKIPGPNAIPSRSLNHLQQQAVSLLFLVFNAILLTHHFPTVWKYAVLISVLKPGKDLSQPS